LTLLALVLITQPAISQDPDIAVKSGPVVNAQEVDRKPPPTELEQEINQIRMVAQEKLVALSEQLAGLDPGSDQAKEVR
jgi:hypothetical protein